MEESTAQFTSPRIKKGHRPSSASRREDGMRLCVRCEQEPGARSLTSRALTGPRKAVSIQIGTKLQASLNPHGGKVLATVVCVCERERERRYNKHKSLY